MFKKNIFTLIIFLLLIPFQANALKVIHNQVILEKLDDFEACLTQNHSSKLCYDGLVRWVSAHRADSFMAGKMSRRLMSHSSAIPFFDTAFTDKKADCNDEDVKLAVVSALDLPEGNDNDKGLIVIAKKIGFELCFLQCKDAILETATLTSNAFINVCHDLAKKELLTGLKAKKCAELK